jgi:hypothetical protein
MTPTCPRCGEPITDSAAFICNGCTNRLEGNLDDVADMLAELDTTARRQTAMPDSAVTAPDCDHAGDCGCGVTLPWNPHASSLAAGLRNAVTTWARVLIHETYGAECGHRSCLESVGPQCWRAQRIEVAAAEPAAYLALNVASIRMRPWAPDIAADFGRRMAQALQAIDRHEDRLYAGPCGSQRQDGTTCIERVWARPEQPAVKCRKCGALHDVAARQTWMLDAAADLELPAGEIASALTLMTRVRVSASTIRSWAHRDALTRRNAEAEPRPLYRVGDVLALVRRPPADEARTA